MSFNLDILPYIRYPVFLRLASGVLATVFLLSAILKIGDLRFFTSSVAAYRLLPHHLVKPFAYILPWLELIFALMLLLGWGGRIGAFGCAILLLLFLFAMGINLIQRRTKLDCGCSGKHHKQVIGYKTITRNLVLLVLTLPLILWGVGIFAIDNLPLANQQYFLNTYLINLLIPLVLTIIGISLLSRLSRQLLRLVYLTFEEPKQ